MSELYLLPLLEEVEDDDLLAIFKDEASISEKECNLFPFNTFSDEYCRKHFRFFKNDIFKLKKALKIPHSFSLENKLKVEGLEALCVLLRRLTYPNRLVDLKKIFPRTECELSRIFNAVIEFVVQKHSRLLKTLKQPYITIPKLKEFANAIHEKGSPFKMCFEFIDGTVRPLCRPNRLQKEYYNGHKRTHALKFQSVMLPNGIIGALSGPVIGRRHDAYILAESGSIEELEAEFNNEEGNPFYLYGDPAYPLRKHLMVPFKGHNLSYAKRMCNKRMSRVRQSVEWGFGKIIQNFAFLDYKKNLRLGLQPVAKYYITAVLLTNCHTCLYGSQTSDYFGLEPPDLFVYMQ